VARSGGPANAEVAPARTPSSPSRQQAVPDRGERIHWRSGGASAEIEAQPLGPAAVQPEHLFRRARAQATPGPKAASGAGPGPPALSSSPRLPGEIMGSAGGGSPPLPPPGDTAQPAFGCTAAANNASHSPSPGVAPAKRGTRIRVQQAIEAGRAVSVVKKKAPAKLRASSLVLGPASRRCGPASTGPQQGGIDPIELVISRLPSPSHRGQGTGANRCLALRNSSAPLLRSRAHRAHHQLAGRVAEPKWIEGGRIVLLRRAHRPSAPRRPLRDRQPPWRTRPS